MTAAARGLWVAEDRVCGIAAGLGARESHPGLPAPERISRYRGGWRIRALARAIRDGILAMDVFPSADTEVIETELFGADVAGCALWYVTFATNSMVFAVGTAQAPTPPRTATVHPRG